MNSNIKIGVIQNPELESKSFNPYEAYVNRMEELLGNTTKSWPEQELELKQLLEIHEIGKQYAHAKLPALYRKVEKSKQDQRIIMVLEDYSYQNQTDIALLNELNKLDKAMCKFGQDETILKQTTDGLLRILKKRGYQFETVNITRKER